MEVVLSSAGLRWCLTPVGIAVGSVAAVVTSIGSVAGIGVAVAVGRVVQVGIGLSLGVSIGLALHNMDSTARVGVVASNRSNGVSDGKGGGVVHGRGVHNRGAVDNGVGNGVDLDFGGLLNDRLDLGGLVDSGSNGGQHGVVGVGQDTGRVQQLGVGVSVGGGGSRGSSEKADL